MPWQVGTKTFKAPAKSKQRKAICRMCKQPIGDKPYVLALREGEGPIDEAKDIARVHTECIPDA